MSSASPAFQVRSAAGVEADTARWSALGAYHLGRYEAAAAASTARYQAMAEWYAGRVAKGEQDPGWPGVGKSFCCIS